MLFKTKHANEKSVGKDINNRKGNSKETNKSRNKVDILTREQEVKIQKEKHKPTIRNKYTTMNMIDMWDSNNLDQEKREAFQLKCIGIKKKDAVRTSKDIGNNPHAVASCQIYDKECEISIPEPNNVNQDERTRLNEVKETSENALNIKSNFVEYIKKCSKNNNKYYLITFVRIRSY